MKIDRLVRILLGFAIAAVCVLIIAALLFLTESAFNVWDRLLAGPRWLLFGYVGAVLGILLLGAWLVWRWLWPRRKTVESERPGYPLDESGLRRRIQRAAEEGLDIDDARRELDLLSARRASGRLHICLLGEISTGKSSLIQALLPGAAPRIDVSGGTTRAVTHYEWQTPVGDTVVITDVPGTNDPDGLDESSREEAQRAHIVVYVCDGDLTADQHEAVLSLISLGKPMALTINKSDRYSDAELEQIMQRVRERLDAISDAGRAVRLIAINTGGCESVVSVDAEGRERSVERERLPRVAPLGGALQELIDEAPAMLDALRDSAVFALAADKLDAAERAHRQSRGEEIVRQYTYKAMLGALAAVSPGTDLLIQGYLGTGMARALCGLHDVPVKDLDIEAFLDLSQSHVGKALPIMMAVAGNGFKAFPGIGTVAGGLLHAAAYGLIFDALGRSLAHTLATRGALAPEAAARRFKESLSDDLEARTRRIAGLAMEASRGATERTDSDLG